LLYSKHSPFLKSAVVAMSNNRKLVPKKKNFLAY
jgi:hypothetical protein